jgi:hypothetical protein
MAMSTRHASFGVGAGTIAMLLSAAAWAQGKTGEGKTETTVVGPAGAAEPGSATPEAGATAEGAPADGAPAEGAPDEGAAPSEQGFNLKLRSIEERVNELKEKIFQSKARLIQLQEVVLHGAISGAKAVLIHRNEMGSSFRLKRIQYALDGAAIVNRVDSGQGELNEIEEMEVFNGAIAPGSHQISVYLEYGGYGYGFFSYLKGYTFKIKSSFTFEVEEGKQTVVKIVGYEKGGITTELKDRPSVRYDLENSQILKPPVGEGSATSGDAAAERK